MSGTPPAHYVKVWAVLVVLLVISVVGPLLGIPILTLLTAFGIAAVKAFLVAKHFMHLDVEKTIVKWILATSVVLMAVLFAGVSPDVMKHEGTNWDNAAAQAAVERGIEDPHPESEGD